MNQPFCLALSIPAILLTAVVCLAQVSENLLKNPSFEEGATERGVPVGWALYGGGRKEQRIQIVEAADTGKKAVRLEDGDPAKEIGLMQSLPVKPGLTYEASVKVRAVEGAGAAGSYLQLRFLPSNQFAQKALAATSVKGFDEIAVRLTAPPPMVSSRHGQWSAISLYCLSRYFQKDYPNPIWAQCMRGAQLAFAPLHEHAWVSGESDNLFWYNTGTAPILTYMVLTGDRKPLQSPTPHSFGDGASGSLATLLRGQEMLVSGRVPDWALNCAAIDFLHKTAYLTQDGRWLTYRDRTGVDLSVFRLGQSFWPEEHLKPTLPADLAGKWSINPLPKRLWQTRGSGLAFDESFFFGSFRSVPDASGDFILIDGFNGASRNPYHCFAILELRIAGQTILQGYLNQVLTKADGMVEPLVAMDAALKSCDVVGQTAFAVAEVPKASFCNWRRSLVQRVGRYALIVDDLTFRAESENVEVETKWQPAGGTSWDAARNALRFSAGQASAPPPGWQRIRAVDAACASQPADKDSLKKLDSISIMLLRATEPGAWIEMPFSLAEPAAGEVYADFIGYEDRGIVRILLEGKVVVEFTMAGGAATMRWLGPVAKDQHLYFFHLIAPSADAGAPARCVRAVVPNAALLALPQPALAVAGEYLGLQGDLVLLSKDHLFGYGVKQVLASPSVKAVGDVAAPINLTYQMTGRQVALIAADSPVHVDWDFDAGRLHVVATKDTRVNLSLAEAGGVRVDGNAVKLSPRKDMPVSLTLAAGGHVIENAKPSEQALRQATEPLPQILARRLEERKRVTVRAAAEPPPTAPALTPAWTASVGGKVVDLITAETSEGVPLFVAADKTGHVRSADGKPVRAMQTDGPIRVLRWWPEHKLLLAGCTDEKVIAFGLDGERKWVFVSEMPPAVLRAAKDYWFKTAPGHEGIHGLHTGVFLDGKSQAFVGSACTLEIVDEHGKLVRRQAVFWGCGSRFALIDCPDGSRNLLIARQPTDGHSLAIINNRKLDQVLRGFDGVPAGHTYVGGWACMSRKHIFYDDLDGDGKKEILAATASGLVVAFDYQCQKRWAKRVPSAPTVLKCVTPQGGKTPHVVIGCENGSVAVLDAHGQLIRSGTVTGHPTSIGAVATDVVLGTDKGELKAFKIAE